MIRCEAALDALAPEERFALEILLDCSGLLRAGANASATEAVVLEVRDDVRADLIEGVTGRLVVSQALLRSVAGQAAAIEEQRSDASDRHGRVPSAANPLVRLGHERLPVVTVLATRIRQAAVAAASGRPGWRVAPWPGQARWAAAVSHDVDAVRLWPALTVRRLFELAGKREWQRMATVTGDATAAIGRNPLIDGAQALLSRLRHHGVRATWFFLAGTPTWRSLAAGDITYAVERSPARNLVRAVVEGGHEVGLHGSFATMDDANAFRLQRERLASVAGTSIEGVRQHFLRMRPGTTHRRMREAGFGYDASYGFPDRNGFRLGVADIVPGWDAARDAPSELDEVPLVWMDRALSKYRGVESPDEWIGDALALIDEVRQVEGCWIGLWHPNLVSALGFPGAPEAFETLLSTLTGPDVHHATIGELVAWRRWRRSLRAVPSGDPAAPPVLLQGKQQGPAIHHLIDLATGRLVTTAVRS